MTENGPLKLDYPRPLTDPRPVTALLPGEVALAAAEHMAALVTPSGQFRYAYDARTGAPLPGYNLLRHCGTAWAMAEIAQAFGRADLVETARRAMHWLLDERTQVNRTGAACIVENEGRVKLGGAGLGIVALTQLGDVEGVERRLEIARGLGVFIREMRRRDGDFHHAIDIRSGAVQRLRSDFYTGEALFGLVRLTEATGEPEWRELAESTIATLAGRDYGVAQQSHWMLYAIAELCRATVEPALAQYAGRIVRAVLDAPEYRKRREATPIACRMEGLGAYVRMLRSGAGETAPRGLSGLPQPGEVVAHLWTDADLLMNHRLRTGAFRRGIGNTTVQIDYVQHCGSAFLRLHQLGVLPLGGAQERP